jgi:formylglycine-generating enzyme required for sulfatase activity
MLLSRVSAPASFVLAFLVFSAYAEEGVKPTAEGSQSTPRGIAIEIGAGTSLELVLIPAGKFTMGRDDQQRPEEGPAHEVTIPKAFYIGKYLVTQSQYQAVTGKNPSEFKGAKHPVETVSWADAKAFCEKLSTMSKKSVRLPTEAEWEYACRAGTKTRFFWGDDVLELLKYAWIGVNSHDRTHPVGEKKPNAWGLFDMIGNVWEYCEDDYNRNYKNAPQDGSAWVDEPRSPCHICRGGSFLSDSLDASSTARMAVDADRRDNWHGFRVVVETTVPDTHK